MKMRHRDIATYRGHQEGAGWAGDVTVTAFDSSFLLLSEELLVLGGGLL